MASRYMADGETAITIPLTDKLHELNALPIHPSRRGYNRADGQSAVNQARSVRALNALDFAVSAAVFDGEQNPYSTTPGGFPWIPWLQRG